MLGIIYNYIIIIITIFIIIKLIIITKNAKYKNYTKMNFLFNIFNNNEMNNGEEMVDFSGKIVFISPDQFSYFLVKKVKSLLPYPTLSQDREMSL